MGFTFREISSTPKPEGESEKLSGSHLSHLDISASPCAGQAGLRESRSFCEVPRTPGNTGSFTLGFTTSR